MVVTNFSYCESMKEEQGKNIIINPFTMIIPYSIPSNYSFFITIGVHDIPHKGANFVFEFISPSREVVLKQDFQVPGAPNVTEKDKVGVQLNVGLQNVVLKEAGIYKTLLHQEGVLLGEYPIEVIPNGQY